MTRTEHETSVSESENSLRAVKRRKSNSEGLGCTKLQRRHQCTAKLVLIRIKFKKCTVSDIRDTNNKMF